MIHLLLDEPSELNEKSMKILSLFPSIDQFTIEIYGYQYQDFNKDIPVKNSVIEFCDTKKEEVEAIFLHFLHFELNRYKLPLDLHDIPKIENSFLKLYREKRDLNDLILSVLCLDALCLEFSIKTPSYYYQCEKYIRKISPQTVQFFRNFMEFNFNKKIEDLFIC